MSEKSEKLRTLEFKTVDNLTTSEKMELVQFASISYFKLVCKVMEWEVIEQRDIAMAVNPAKETEQRAAMTEAHAMAKFYTRFRNTIDAAIREHRGEVEEHVVKQQLDDPEFLSELMTQN